MFRPVSGKVDFPELERRILSFWQEKQVFERSVEQRRGSPLYVLYDGPPTANASPGIHHVLARVFKDLFPRYKAMKGYCVPRRAGWDTHGLPVELEVERELGLKSKRDIEEYGIAAFNIRCRQNVLKYVKEWEELTDRIGFWIDMKHPYITFDNNYIETCWWIIKELWNKGLIYQGYKVTPHCPRCETSLSSHEVALGYRDDTIDPSVYIKFRLTSASKRALYSKLALGHNDVDTFFLAWTTTPWTLLGNTALAVAENAEYALVELVKVGAANERLILATARLKIALKDEYKIIATFKGSDLLALMYESLYDLMDDKKYPGFPYVMQFRDGVLHYDLDGSGTLHEYRVVAGDFVSMEDGTGIVHIAPAYGEVDNELGREENLWFLHPVRLTGKVDDNLKPFGGKSVKEADPLILADLESRELLYRKEQISHTYPFCWRCETPLLYYAKTSWYIKTTGMKDRLISGNAEINWYPEYIKYGRFGDWLENNVDWAFSRERYWGTPLPLWRCIDCRWGEVYYYECVGSMDELKRKPGIKGVEGLSDLHRPYVDEVTYSCPKCGGEMRRVPEVIDCWFDSGAMPFAQWHYPFENQALFNDNFPADYICEAVDQTRGWFYSLHALSILLKEQPCFKNVICLGHILDSAGEKMSKSKGNVVRPKEVLDASGADALRWYMYTSAPPGNVRRFSRELVEEVVRKFLLTLWNTYSFFVTYANIDKFDPRTISVSEHRPELDRWILSELNRLVDGVTSSLEEYDPTAAGRKIEDFVDGLSNWYVRRSRRRFWKSENDADKRSAYITLYQCLMTLARLLAPFTPFVAEDIYLNLVRTVDHGAPESVHLTDYPLADLSLVDEKLAADARLAMMVSSIGRAARAKAGIKVRQPLAKALVKVRSEGEKESVGRVAPQVLDELNVKELRAVESLPVAEHPNWPVVEEGGLSVMIDSDVSRELAHEGLARELVHRLQTMRKQAGFDIADYIETVYQGAPSIQQVIEGFAAYIRQETLSRTLIQGSPPEGAFVKTHVIDGNEVTLAVKKSK